MKRAAALIMLAGLTACSQDAPEEAGELISCAIDGSREFKRWCGLERTVFEGRKGFVVRHPNGAFRRLEVSADGQNLLAADGADQTQSALKRGRYEVILGPDRYVIPQQPPGEADASAP
jgi:hypothetical protein